MTRVPKWWCGAGLQATKLRLVLAIRSLFSHWLHPCDSGKPADTQTLPFEALSLFFFFLSLFVLFLFDLGRLLLLPGLAQTLAFVSARGKWAMAATRGEPNQHKETHRNRRPPASDPFFRILSTITTATSSSTSS